MAANRIALCSVSWIDEKPLPKVGFWFVAGAAVSWPKRVIMGLVGTSNPEPPMELASIEGFQARQQYRALISCSLDRQRQGALGDTIIDPGYTPPFDKSKLDTRLRHVAPIPDDPKFYPGDLSPLSGVSAKALHKSSSLTVPRDHEVLVSAFIKFRAGKDTDNVGITEAKSPVHVPWVWCEYALVSSGSKFRLLGQGSTFPSHAWYVNGTQVAKRLQGPVTVSERDPAISTGRPAAQARAEAANDTSDGAVTGHEYAVAPGDLMDVDVSRFVI